MHGSMEILCENDQLHTVLLSYRQMRKEHRDVEWHDRIMELPSTTATALSKLHGTLLALGWLDTRVDRAVFETPGKLVQCYRITNDGIRALNHYDRNMGLAGMALTADELHEEGEE